MSCIRGNCGEPRESPVHDDDSDDYQHDYADDGAPGGYDAGRCGHGNEIGACAECALAKWDERIDMEAKHLLEQREGANRAR